MENRELRLGSVMQPFEGVVQFGRKPACRLESTRIRVLCLPISAMNTLELKIPPPVVGLLFGLVMWGISLLTEAIDISLLARSIVSLALALVGGAFSLLGAIGFRRARTTVNPMKPESTSSLVTGGVYRVTRNPMYVGLLFVLIGWAAFLASPWSFIGPVAFVLYISRFQITPEERVLAPMFGENYANYKTRVRRWL